jgi:hypothetical protein
MAERGCLARTRTYNTPPEHQALTSVDAHPCAHDLQELIAAWPLLPATLQSAVLEIVRSFMVATEGSLR